MTNALPTNIAPNPMNMPLRTGVGVHFKLRVPTIEWKPGARETSNANKMPRIMAMVPIPPRASQRFKEIPGMSNISRELVSGELDTVRKILRIVVLLNDWGT